MAAARKPAVLGLEDVVVANTQLSMVDGATGRLLIRGYPIQSLALEYSFEAVLALLWRGSLPVASELATVRQALALARCRVAEQLREDVARHPSVLHAVRSAIAGMTDDADPFDLVAMVAVVAPRWHRMRRGLHPVEPDASIAHCADFLRMLRGHPPETRSAEALATYFVTVVDHGMNASTFAARVIASTGTDLPSAVLGALGALKGPLHGGAPGPVLDMLDAVETRRGRTSLALG